MTLDKVYNLACSGVKLTHEQELLIASDAVYAYHYAQYVLKNRFELGESVIATNCDTSLWYATNVLKSRFELGEQSISRGIIASYHYSTTVLNAPFNIICVVLKSKHKDDYLNWYFRNIK